MSWVRRRIRAKGEVLSISKGSRLKRDDRPPPRRASPVCDPPSWRWSSWVDCCPCGGWFCSCGCGTLCCCRSSAIRIPPSDAKPIIPMACSPCAGGTRHPQHRPRGDGAVVDIVVRTPQCMRDVRRCLRGRPYVLRPHRAVRETHRTVRAHGRETPSPCSACTYVDGLI